MKIKSLLCAAVIGIAAATSLTGCGNGSPEENLVSAIRAAETGKWAEAKKFADRAVVGSPDHIGALIMRSIACEKCEKYDQAVDSARRAVNLAPNSFAALYTLGKLYSSDPLRNAEAVNTLNKALRIRPDSVETKILLCNIFNRMYANAGERYLLQLKKNQEYANDSALLSQLGVIYARSNRTAHARNMFMAAYRSSDGKNPDIVFNAARFFSEYQPIPKTSKKLYAIFSNLAAGREKYTAELAEAKAAIGR
ncbi:MAG: hypothetical protein IJC21_00555 [Lentisphaeria bacterium]|nr:hypothetical protein [Lentisphaeria bacterium]